MNDIYSLPSIADHSEVSLDMVTYRLPDHIVHLHEMVNIPPDHLPRLGKMVQSPSHHIVQLDKMVRNPYHHIVYLRMMVPKSNDPEGSMEAMDS